MNRNILNLRHLTVLLMLCTAFLGGIIPAFAQQGGKKITGQVIDENKEPMIGVSILIVGTSTGTVTDFDGNYTLNVPQGSKELQFSYVGYETKVVPVPANSTTLNVQLKSDSQVLSDVVVIGYGTQRKSDLTGSVTNVSSKDFNMGLVSSPEQLINGKISGVQIMSNSGSPTAGSTIRVRGGASLNASNDPLIVLDGVPLEQGGISGNDGNFLSLINPNDIESMTILKDASSTAIYGSRASNGVILITTKKGSSDKLKITFSTTNSIQTRTKLADMLSYDQFVNTIRTQGTTAQQSLLGTAHTDWNDEIYQNAFGTDNNLSISGKIAKNWPFRISVGYYNQSGLLRTDNAERYTGSIMVTPSFFKDHLKLNINAKGSINNNTFGNTNAIWAASTMNPTIPVYSGLDTFGGYTEAIDNTGAPANGAVMNPVGLIKMNDSQSNVRRFIGNIDADYRVHFFPDLKLHATLGYDYAQGKGSVYVPAEAAQNYTTSGLDYSYGPQKKENRLLTLYANYNKLVESIKSSFDVTAGYDYQYWKATTPLYYKMNTLGEIQKTSKAKDERHVLLSYYGRLNYSFDSRYMLTTTIRRDATSRFAKNVRWGTFPSVALGWRVTEESFLKDNKVLSNLKIRASYGVTGQQDGIGNYNYLPIYTQSQNGAEGIMGNEYIHTYRPSSYVPDLKWETTTSWNIEFDGVYQSSDFYTTPDNQLILKEGVTNNARYGTVKPGVVKYKDQDGDGIITTNDRTVIGNAMPKWFGGITNTFDYKGIDFSFMLQFNYGNDIYNATRLYSTQSRNGRRNMLAEVADRWSPTNTSNLVPSQDGYIVNDVYSRFIEDGSFLRLKNLVLGYTFPKELMQKATISNLRVYVQAENILTITGYSGLDPEFTNANVSEGNGSDLRRGMDMGGWPTTMRFLFGVNFAF